jgi:hypothetical protein
MTRVWGVAVGFLLLAGSAEAQGAPVKYGKWLLLAGSIGMNYLAIQAHNDADSAFNDLEQRCFEVRSRCDLGPDGAYQDPVSEALYQSSLHEDRVARRWLVAGEVALAGAAALFVWELTRPKGRPENIPFEPEIRSLRSATGLGLRFHF